MLSLLTHRPEKYRYLGAGFCKLGGNDPTLYSKDGVY